VRISAVFSFFRKGNKDDRTAGEDHYAKGRWAQALEAYERVLVREPENVKILRRVADLRAKAGRRADAVEAYRKVADHFAAAGFLVQAIAIQKILLRLDPSTQDIGHKLAELYAKRGLSGPSGASDEERRELPRIPLFSDLDPESFRQLLERLVPRTLAPGEFLFRQGDPGDSIFVIAAGTVKVTRGEFPLAELGEGEFFGEAAFFSRDPRNADVSAATPADLLEIRRVDVEGLMTRYPGVTEALGSFYRRRILDDLLASSPLFGSLPETARKRIADLFRTVKVAPGTPVVREGAEDRAFYLIRRGRFAVTMVPPHESEPVRLAELGPGQFFGEVALVARTPRTATVSALEDADVLQIEACELDPFLAAHPELRLALEEARDRRAEDTVSKVIGRRT
jgi:cAMP-dependent protein kinase regulator